VTSSHEPKQAKGTVEWGNLAVWATLFTLLAIWIGAAVGGCQVGEGKHSGSTVTVRTARGIDFSLPGGLARTNEPGWLLAGLGIEGLRAYAPSGGLGEASVVVGVSQGRGPALLSPIARMHWRESSSPEAEELGQYTAVRVSGTVAGGRQQHSVVIYSVPTRTLTVNVLCLLGFANGPFAESCTRLAVTLDLSDGHDQAIDFSELMTYSGELHQALSPYLAQAPGLRRQLVSTRHAGEQASIARRLAKLCAGAARSVADLSFDPIALSEQRILRSGLDEDAGAYHALATAAADGDEHGWALARRLTYAGDVAVGEALGKILAP